FLVELYRSLDHNYDQIKINRAQREAYGTQIRALAEQIKVGTQTPDILLEAERFYATALVQEYQFVAFYNMVLAGWDVQKGTLSQHDHVVISEGALTPTAQVRAVEHERQRSLALSLRERQNPVECQPLHCDSNVGLIPQIPSGTAGALPSVMKEHP